MAPTFRPGTLADSHAIHNIVEICLEDFGRRINLPPDPNAGDPAAWQRSQSLFEHLGRTADQFWMAEEDGEAIGFARSILRDGVRELTEFFVLPARQSAGVGRALLARAFPLDGARHRSIVATIDARALGRYLRAGVYPYFPIYFFRRPPEVAPEPSDLSIEPFAQAEPVLAELRGLDQAVLGYTRDVDHLWLARERQGWLYRRQGQVVGYGYAGANNGPMAMLNASDYPAVLAHIAAQAAARGYTETGFEVPLVNRAAVDYLLSRDYRMAPFFAFYLCDALTGHLENYVVTSPPFFL